MKDDAKIVVSDIVPKDELWFVQPSPKRIFMMVDAAMMRVEQEYRLLGKIVSLTNF